MSDTRDKVIRIGINGFGRIGRLALRLAWQHPQLHVVHINEIGALESSAYLLKFDSVHHTWRPDVRAENGEMVISEDTRSHRITYSQHRGPGDVSWGDMGCDIVLECSGAFLTRAALAPFFSRGVRKVIVSAPVKDPQPVLNVVMGVNQHLYDPARDDIVTAASCTTNCLAPVVKVVHEKIGILRGSITTIHNVTNTQLLVDAPNAKKDDLRRARSGLVNLSPTTTGSATAIALIFPELKGKLDGHAIRVPLTNASITDCVFEVKQSVTREQVNQYLKDASETYLKGILGFEERPLVSTDYVNDERSSIIDAASTLVVDGSHVKIYAWYDNEYGYSARLVDLARYVADRL